MSRQKGPKFTHLLLLPIHNCNFHPWEQSDVAPFCPTQGLFSGVIVHDKEGPRTLTSP